MEFFKKFTVNFGKPACVILYAAFSYLAANITVIPLIALVVMHLTEYFIIGFKTAKEYKINPVSGFLNCLCFGFTWWLPVRSK